MPGSGFNAQPTPLEGPIDDKSQIAATYSPAGDEHVFFVSKGVISNDYFLPGMVGWNGPGGLAGKPDSGTPLAATAATDGNWNVFFTQQGAIDNIYVQNNGPVGGPALVLNAGSTNGLASAGIGSTVGSSVFWTFDNELYASSYGAGGWQSPIAVSPVPPDN